MDVKEIITEVLAMTDIRAGKVLKFVLSAVVNGEGFSTGLFEKAIMAIDKPTRIKSRLNPETDLEKTFEIFRQSYKGTKRGFATEYGNLQRKHADWKTVVPKLIPAWQKEVAWHEQLNKSGAFCPQYKNLQTWINQRCWETEFNMEMNGKTEYNARNASNAIRRLSEECY